MTWNENYIKKQFSSTTNRAFQNETFNQYKYIVYLNGQKVILTHFIHHNFFIMNPERLLVYKAGAGSGKTFQIAKRYLKRLIQNQNAQIIYRLIGITFTNKAAEEMKKRIIENLIKASKGHITDVMIEVAKDLKDAIKKQTGITKDVDYQQEIIKRSRQRLQEILHRYDEFQLTTIDKLMYKIIKTFARDMHLSTDVEVEMDYKEVISRLIDNLLNKAEPNSLLSRFFIDLALEKINEERHWDIKKDLVDIDKIIFDDNHFEALKSLENKTLEDFSALKKHLISEKNKLLSYLSDRANQAASVIKGYETVIYADVIKHIKSLREAYKAVNIDEKLMAFIDRGVYYKKQGIKQFDEQGVSNLTGPVNDALHRLMLDIKTKNIQLMLIVALLEKVNALSIENELQKEISDFKETNNRIFISDFNKLILEQILKDLSGDTPYIYMRLGEKYAHYFIDEFQDTSALQWQNLIPLVREALSKEFTGGYQGDTMIVGDAKQSIYRFRGGKPEQFIALSDPQQQQAEGNPFAEISRKAVDNLPFNWRSKEQIINFNNDFFKTFTKYLSEPYRQVYADPAQQIPEGRITGEGYINFRFLKSSRGPNKETFEEAVYQAVVQAQTNGFKKEEICILINKNNDGKKIATLLNQNNIEVVSSETLIVANAGKVRFLISWLYFLQSGNPYELYNAVRYLAERDDKAKAELYETLINDKKITKTEQIKRFEKIGYVVEYERFVKFNLYDTLVYLINVFGLSDETEQAYLQAFLEKVYQFTQKDTPTLKAFLNDWEVIADKFSIAIPEKKGAVKIMTVHKAKGLEFPVVIYYTDEVVLSSKDKETGVWIPVNPEQFSGFDILPVKMGVLKHSPIKNYQNIYQKTAAEQTFDNLNRIYVAFTRAVEQLFVITYYTKKSKNLKVSEILYDYLKTKYPGFDGQIFESGQAKRTVTTGVIEEKPLQVNNLHYINWQLKQKEGFLKINTNTFERWSANKKAAIVYGMQLHEILSRITTATQWQQQKEKLLRGIDDDLKTKIETLVEKTIYHPQLKMFFSGAYTVCNERDILIPAIKGAFRQKRPDRLLLKNNDISIIDYKTGNEQPEHIKQLQTYAGYLQQAGFNTVNRILVYLSENNVRVKFVS